MNAAHFLRSRQERQELRYWLSIVSFDIDDRSFVNRAYLFYLFAFFSVWFLAVLVFFASGAIKLFALAGMSDIARLTIGMEAALLAIWLLIGLFQALRASPLILSETDALILCQTPLARAGVILRWFVMPWIKSYVPFGFLFILVGFILAETAGFSSLGNLITYILFGVRNALLLLPLHMALLAVIWTVGLVPFRRPHSLLWLKAILTAVLVAIALLAVLLFFSSPLLPAPVVQWAERLPGIWLTWLAASPSVAFSLLMIAVPVAALSLLCLVSRRVNLSHLAETTVVTELIQSLQRFGFSSSADDEVLKGRLSGKQATRLGPPAAGWQALAWLNKSRVKRRFSVKSLQPWLMILIFSFSLALIPLTLASLFVLLFFIQHIAQIATNSLTQNMNVWSLLRQLPFTPAEIIRGHLLPLLAPLLAVEAVGFLLGSLFTPRVMLAQIVFLLVLSIMIMMLAIWDCFSNSRALDLYSDSPARSGYRTLLIALALCGLYMLLAPAQPLLASLSTALVIAVITAVAYRWAKSAWQKLLTP